MVTVLTLTFDRCDYAPCGRSIRPREEVTHDNVGGTFCNVFCATAQDRADMLRATVESVAH